MRPVTPSKPQTNPRHRAIATIKMAQSHFGWDDAFYRSVLVQVTGRSSCTQCTPTELAKMVAHVEAAGFVRKPAASTKHRPVPAPAKQAMVSKIRAQLIALGNKPDEYADAILRGLRGGHVGAIYRYEQASHDDLHSIVAALTKQQQRVLNPR